MVRAKQGHRIEGFLAMRLDGGEVRQRKATTVRSGLQRRFGSGNVRAACKTVGARLERRRGAHAGGDRMAA
jgi:hypothetical protein